MQQGTNPRSTLATGTFTATFTTAGTATGAFRDCVAYLSVTAAAGTAPTLTVTLQDSPDGVVWYPIPSGAFTQVTGAATQRIVATQLGSFVRAVGTIAGTTPSFTLTLDIAGLG